MKPQDPHKRRPRLSVAMITKNEGRRVRRALESVRWADEIVLVDSESTDDTVAVAREFATTIRLRKFDNFMNQKNAAVELATGEWVLSLDADEVVSRELAEEIRHRINDSTAPCVAYSVPRMNFICGRPIEHVLQNDTQLKLFRNACRFIRPVHEYVDIQGEIGQLEHPLLHYNSASPSEFIRKNELYAVLDATAQHHHGRRFSMLKLIASPIRTWWFRYLTIGGYKDGGIGLLVSLVLAYSTFRFYLKLWELQKTAKAA